MMMEFTISTIYFTNQNKEVAMKQLFMCVALMFLLVSSFAFSQGGGFTRVPYEFQPQTPTWGNDVVIHPREATGPITGMGKSNGTAFVAVPDTVNGRFLTVYKSTNFGNTWAPLIFLGPPTGFVSKTKMVRASGDSVYLFYLLESRLVYFNLDNTASPARQFDTTGIRDFDVATTSTGGMYLFYDMNANDAVRRAASSDNGTTWPQRATVSSASAFPRVSVNRQAVDTLILNYYGPVRATGDTLRSVIRQARYREVAPGNIASAGFIDVDNDSLSIRSEYASVKIGNVVWFVSTKGATGSIDIQARASTDAGLTYGTPFLVAGNPNIDEYWFNIANYTLSSGGLDFVYYADSLGAVVNTGTDKVMYGFLAKGTPSTVAGRTRLSDRPLTWSARGYEPTLFEYYDVDGEVGVVWVGLDGSDRKVYYDRYNAIATNVTPSNGGVPDTYTLKQNYPNPFNPTTTIEFAVPKNEFVTVKVFDILGREVQTLVAENLNAGSYKTRFNADQLSSGVYLYQLRAGNFVQTKKLTLMK
jgi:hypothetical protein